MSAVPTLTDGVVTLRAPREADLAGIVEQSSDPQMQRWTTVPVPYTRDDAATYVRHIIPGGWETEREWTFAVEAADDDGRPRFCALVSLRNEGPGRAEIAYGSHPWIRGRGLVERALRLLLEWGFAERDLQTVSWLAQRGNWPSRRLAWRLGFVVEGTLSGWLQTRDGLADAWVATLPSGVPLAPRSRWLDAPTVHGRAVVLRRQHEDDTGRVLEACGDERTSYWLGQLPVPYTRTDALHFLGSCAEEMADGRAVHWTVAAPGTDLALGAVSLMLRGPGADAEIGYWTHPAARGRGVTTEAVGLAVRHAVVPVEDGGLGLSRLEAYAAVGNTASRHVLESNGFRPTGVRRAAETVRDGRVDLAGYDLLHGDVEEPGGPDVLR